jgi:glutathione synthase/RimK-type ligase-like ATP-grasp enzyme
MFDIVVLTQAEYINPSKVDWYVQNILDEDNFALDALAAHGLKVCKKDWADPSFDWTTARALIFRTTWDYFDRYSEFAPWLARVSKSCLLLNSADIIKWNIDKNYLQDLMSAGLNVAPTEFLKRDTPTTLSSLFEKTGWSEAVLKPAISGAARHTYRLTPASAPSHESIFSELISSEDMLFQEFLNDIVAFGEISLMFMGGNYTHAVRKIAKSGDFRVQDDHGGRVEIHRATPEEIAFGQAALSACPFDPIYARIDIVRDNSGNLSLCELELIEPELWFRNNPSAADSLAKACILALT